MWCWQALFAALALVALQVDAKRFVCYYGSWAVYRPGDGKFDVEQIDPTLCTHLVYTFVGVSSEGGISILDSWNEVDKGALNRFIALKQKSPSTKVMVAIGGWNAGSYTFSQVVASDSLRAKFVDNIAAFVEKWGFDGFDLDWEYPALRGGGSNDKANFAKLIKELRPKFDAKGFILSAAVSAGKATIDASYDVPALNQYLHFINVMSYDFHGSWDPKTGENAPLYSGPSDSSESEREFNVDYAIKYWIKLGAKPENLNLGMGTYGRSFSLQSATNRDVGSAITGPGAAGPYTREAGTLGFNELCEQKSQWTEYWNEPQQVPYAVNGNQWVGYDNVKSIGLKTKYILDNNLGGAMVWSVETDDFLGKCGYGKNPLMSTIKSVLNGAPVTEPSTSATTAGTQGPTSGTTAPTGSPSGVCTKTGYVRDPSNCAVFYYCQLVDGKYQPVQYNCAAGTYFDPAINACNWANQVQC